MLGKGEGGWRGGGEGRGWVRDGECAGGGVGGMNT